jgi:DNA polymerase I-like protein with 3'-5' exonuclease and polymerase domains
VEDYKGPDAVFLATIHDEINASVPQEQWEQEMYYLRTAMDQDLFDVPMRSEGFYGPNWGNLQEMDDEYERG